MKGIILGKELKSYVDKNTGEVKTGRTLYVVWDSPKNTPDGFSGNKCESVYVPFDIPTGVDIGVKCDFEYEIQQFRTGLVARLVDIVPLEQYKILFQSIK